MARQGYDVHLVRYADRGWRANFYVTSGTGHSMTSATGSAWASTPWRAIHEAAWDALTKEEREDRPAADVVVL